MKAAPAVALALVALAASPAPAQDYPTRFVESEIVHWGAVVDKAGLTASQ